MLWQYILDINLRRNGEHMAKDQIISISKFNKLKRSTSLKIKLAVQNISVFYNGKMAVENINMNINQNEVTAFIGPSGCGKSTFIRCINRMNDTISSCKISGTITIDDKNIYDKNLDVVFLSFL